MTHEIADWAYTQDFRYKDIRGQGHSLFEQLQQGPVLAAIVMTHVHASRLVLSYLKRLKTQAPAAQILLLFQGDIGDIEAYTTGYLDDLLVAHDKDLSFSYRFRATHVPTVLYLKSAGAGLGIDVQFSGFKKYSLNALAKQVQQDTGAKVKELITANDNKGEYELAERGLLQL